LTKFTRLKLLKSAPKRERRWAGKARAQCKLYSRVARHEGLHDIFPPLLASSPSDVCLGRAGCVEVNPCRGQPLSLYVACHLGPPSIAKQFARGRTNASVPRAKPARSGIKIRGPRGRDKALKDVPLLMLGRNHEPPCCEETGEIASAFRYDLSRN